MKELQIILFLAGGHGLNDLIAGFFLGSLLHAGYDTSFIGVGLITYNLLAFGGQYPVAILLRKLQHPKYFLLIAVLLNVIAISLFSVLPAVAIIFSGIASAIYHVAGGSICANNNKAFHIGLFAAPGVAGLIAGGYFAYIAAHIFPWLLVSAIIFLIGIFIIPIRLLKYKLTEEENTTSAVFDRHDLIMILLLTVISLRSAIWNIFQLIHENNYKWLIAIALSAAAGKIVGGWIADRVGWRLYIIASLIAATPLITFFKEELVLFCIGIGLLQSGIPATTSLLIKSVKGQTETGIALSFGTAIIIGGVVLFTPLRMYLSSDYFLLGSIGVTIIILLGLNKLRAGAAWRKI